MVDSEHGGPAVRDAAAASDDNGGTQWDGSEGGIDAAVQAALDARDVSDPALMPLMTGASIDELKTYQSLFIVDTFGDPPKGASALTAAVDPFAEPPSGQDLPAVGVLTTHHQSWTQRGLALGNLLHSVCLAPGEVTQVAVVDWRRQTTGTSSETTDQAEGVTSAADQTRAVNEVQNAIAREAQSGGSASAAVAGTAQAGVSVGGLLAAGSASSSISTSTAMTAQFSMGARNLAASSTNALSQRTAETSQALRSRRAAVVKEVSEHEAENLSARVLANYNRRHALNIEYFEVLQLYAIETRLASWDRCLFVPMQLIDFTKPEVVSQHKASLTRIFIESGRGELVDQLLFDDDSGAAKHLDQELAVVDARIEEGEAKLRETIARSRALEDALPAARALDSARAQGGKPGEVAAKETAYSILVASKMLQGVPGASELDLASKILSAQQDCVSIRAGLEGPAGTIAKAHRDREALIAKRAALRLTTTERLMAEQLTLSQAIWMRMDPFRAYRTLAKYTLNGEPLATLVEPFPLGVFGNYVAFRWGFERTDDGEMNRKDFESKYIVDGREPSAVTSNIAVPTSGVFAEAVLGRGQAAETIDDTRLWDWNAFPIPILPEGLAFLARDRGREISLDTHDFDSALAELRASDPNDVSHVDGIVGAASGPSMFRNMSGLAQAVTLADRVAAISGSGAQDAGARAAEIHGKILDTFVDVLNSDVGKAAVAEFMLPGSGAAVLQAGGSGEKAPKESEAAPA